MLQGLLCCYIFCLSPRTRHISKGLSVGYGCCYWDGLVFNEDMLSGLVIFGVQTLLDLGNISFWYLTFTGTPTTVGISFIHLTFIEYLRVKLNRKVQREHSVQNVYQKGEITWELKPKEPILGDQLGYTGAEGKSLKCCRGSKMD